MNKVHEVLVAWREAERQLHLAIEPDEIERLTLVAAELHEAYRVEVEQVAVEPEPTVAAARTQVS